MSDPVQNNSKEASRSWFCVLNNPQAVFPDLTDPADMVQAAIDKWCNNKPYRTCAINYEIGDTGNHHMHMVLEDPSKSRFSAVQKMFPGIHIERTRGTKEQAEDYIMKRGRFAEKNHTVIVPAVFQGTIKANQGKRNDLDVIQELIEQGKTPNEITDLSIHYLRYESLIRKAYFRKRYNETPPFRKVRCYWHTGESGSGKSHVYRELCSSIGADHIYFMNDYDKGGLDMYNGEEILFMDEFKSGIRFQLLLNLLDGYRIQIPCRYANVYALYTEVHITSVFPPEEAYRKMVTDNRDTDTLKQLFRRLTAVVYHWKDGKGYYAFSLPAEQYTGIDSLISAARSDSGFSPIPNSRAIPFN